MLRSGYAVTRNTQADCPIMNFSTPTPVRLCRDDPHVYRDRPFVRERATADPPERLPPPLFPPTYGYTQVGPQQRIPQISQFSGENLKGDVEFEVWKYEVSCLLRDGIYSESAVLEAVRRSLKGKARTVLLHLGEWATMPEIMREMEGIYGIVSSSEELKEQFYSATQREGESVVDYSLRLEHLLCSYKMDLDRETRNDMLRTRLWSGLRDQELKNVSRFKYETERSYTQLRKVLRQIEQELHLSRKSTNGTGHDGAQKVRFSLPDVR